MPQHRILRYFEEWLAANRQRFLCLPKIRQRGKRFVEFTFAGLHPDLRGFVNRWGDIMIGVLHQGEYWDFFVDFDVIEERTPTGEYICTLCLPEHRERFLSRRALWEQHGFEAMLKWTNEHITSSEWMCLQAFGDGGIRVASIGEPEAIIARIRREGGLVRAFPVRPAPRPLKGA